MGSFLLLCTNWMLPYEEYITIRDWRPLFCTPDNCGKTVRMFAVWCQKVKDVFSSPTSLPAAA